ncbi:unnamed protein product [Coccothraustes coccothraustes]
MSHSSSRGAVPRQGQVCILFGESNDRNIQEGPSPGNTLKGHSPDIKSLVSTVLCASCIWEVFVFVPAHFEILLAVELKEP